MERKITDLENQPWNQVQTTLPVDIPIQCAITVFVNAQGEIYNCDICRNKYYNLFWFWPRKDDVKIGEDWQEWVFQFLVHEEIAANPHPNWYAVYEKVPLMERTKAGFTKKVPIGEGWSSDPEAEQ